MPSAVPAPPAPPPPSLTPKTPTSKSSTKSAFSSSAPAPAPPAGGALPFLAEINAKRDDSFVVDGSLKSHTTQPEFSTETSSLTKEIGNGSQSNFVGKSKKSAPSAPPIPNSSVPPIPGMLPLQRKPTQIPTPPAPSQQSSIPPTPKTPPVSQKVKPLIPPVSNDSSSHDDTNNSQTSPLRAPPLPTGGPPLLPPPPPTSSAPAMPKLKKAAPPPPPPSGSSPSSSSTVSRSRTSSSQQQQNNYELDSKQHAGSSLRKISALAYTINGHSNSSSSGQKVVIDDKRFKFVNANALPNPRRYEGAKKLYPSGRGSSIPLDLSLYD